MVLVLFLVSRILGTAAFIAILIAIYKIPILILSWKYKKTEYFIQTHTPYICMLRDKGRKGEYFTYRSLTALPGYKKFLFNCYLPKNDGATTELDIILLHESGIYIFESKNYSGWIFGSENQQQWTQSLPAGRGKSHKEHFLNPIIQNKVHLKWLREFIGKELPMFSYIIFSDRCTLKNVTLTSEAHHVINRYDILAAVKQNTIRVEKALSAQDIDDLYNSLYPLTQTKEEDRLKHIENIQLKYTPPQAPIEVHLEEKVCPRCEGKLILRTAAKGERMGKEFWGCSNYPKCRYIENIDK